MLGKMEYQVFHDRLDAISERFSISKAAQDLRAPFCMEIAVDSKDVATISMAGKHARPLYLQPREEQANKISLPEQKQCTYESQKSGGVHYLQLTRTPVSFWVHSVAQRELDEF